MPDAPPAGRPAVLATEALIDRWNRWRVLIVVDGIVALADSWQRQALLHPYQHLLLQMELEKQIAEQSDKESHSTPCALNHHSWTSAKSSTSLISLTYRISTRSCI